MSVEKPHKIAIVAPVPFYYHVPLYRQLASSPLIDLTVYYCSDETLKGSDIKRTYMTEGKIVDSKDLLDGYKYKFVKNYSPVPSFMNWPFGLVNFGICKEIKNGGYDAVILQSWTNLTWWMAFLTCIMFKIPVLFMTDSNIMSEPSKSRIKKTIKKILLGNFLFKKSSGFLTSGKANEQFYKYYGVPEEKMARTPFSWGYEYFLNKADQLKPERGLIRASLGIRKEEFVILYVGRLSKEKSPEVVLKAYHEIDHENKRLIFVGDGPIRKRLEQFIEESGVKGVFFAGFQLRENISNFYIASDALVLPSEHETWGIVVNEALCFSLPVIASNRVGAGVDLVKNGYNGFVFPVGDINKLSEAIKRLIDMPVKDRLIFGEKSFEIINKWIEKLEPAHQILKLFKKHK